MIPGGRASGKEGNGVLDFRAGNVPIRRTKLTNLFGIGELDGVRVLVNGIGESRVGFDEEALLDGIWSELRLVESAVCVGGVTENRPFFSLGLFYP